MQVGAYEINIIYKHLLIYYIYIILIFIILIYIINIDIYIYPCQSWSQLVSYLIFAKVKSHYWSSIHQGGLLIFSFAATEHVINQWEDGLKQVNSKSTAGSLRSCEV